LIGLKWRNRALSSEGPANSSARAAGCVGRQRNLHEIDRGIEQDIFHDFLILLLVVALVLDWVKRSGY
jgi:hypothetical protein